MLKEHEQQRIAPGGDVIRKFLPRDKPVLILMDELMNFVSRSRKSGMAAQLYSFLHNLSEEARGRDNMVLAVSIPASELEMSAEDFSDYDRLKKLLDRVGKAVMMSAESETSEIIRRRLFEWDESQLTPDGRIMLTRDALATCNDYGDWVREHRQQIPDWFAIDYRPRSFRRHLSISPHRVVGVREEVAGIAAVPADPRDIAACWRFGFPRPIRQGSRVPALML